MDFSRRRLLTIAGAAVANTFISSATHGAIMDLVSSENDDLAKATRAIRDMLDFMPKGYWSYDGLWSRYSAPWPEMYIKMPNATREDMRLRFGVLANSEISDEQLELAKTHKIWPNPAYEEWRATRSRFFKARENVREGLFANDAEKKQAESDFNRKFSETLDYLMKLIENNPSREDARAIVTQGVTLDFTHADMGTTLELIPITMAHTLIGGEMAPLNTTKIPSFTIFAERYHGLLV